MATSGRAKSYLLVAMPLAPGMPLESIQRVLEAVVAALARQPHPGAVQRIQRVQGKTRAPRPEVRKSLERTLVS